ncbi:MAG: nicotinate-nucleotide adenylyltransferase [Rhodospirillales bacterium]|nr:nicotinate-nucleotide adenylyltransferase [Rhodospirillales bacterium]MSP80839.1 nicotinate-nucleotide adenylyltransferase [Rhodospirillales bacterium]
MPASPVGARLTPRRRVGLLGGSFNPAHEGHLHISRAALAKLRLDQVWWLVSPQNPLKPVRGMAALATRVRIARAVARHPRIRVTAIESELGTTYTADTLDLLTARHPDVRFVWLMGADNLIQISRWRDWRAIFGLVPVAVFARPTYSLPALASVAARRFAQARISETAAGALADARPPAWAFFHIRSHAASATAIRARRSAQDGAKDKDLIKENRRKIGATRTTTAKTRRKTKGR